MFPKFRNLPSKLKPQKKYFREKSSVLQRKCLCKSAWLISGDTHPGCMNKGDGGGGDGRRAPVPKVTDHIATPLRSRKNYVQVIQFH